MGSFPRTLAWVAGVVLAVAVIAAVVASLIFLAVQAFIVGAILGGVLYAVGAFVVYVFCVALMAHLTFKNRRH